MAVLLLLPPPVFLHLRQLLFVRVARTVHGGEAIVALFVSFVRSVSI